MMKSLFYILLSFILFFTVSCAGTTGQMAEQTLDGVDEYGGSEAIDTECSYFYFLWAKTAESKGLNYADEALEAYEKAVVCDPQAEYLIRNLAALLVRMDRKKQALAWVEKLINQRPDDQKIRVFQADLYSAIGQKDQALKIYKEVLNSDKSNTDLMLKLGKHYLNDLDYTQARIIFERLVKQETDSFAGHYYLAKLYRELRYFRKAFAEYQKALDLSWSVPLAMETAGLYEDQELFDDAIAIYRKLMVEEDMVAAAGRLVRIYLEMDESDKALSVLQDLRKTTLDSQSIDLTIGRILMEQKEYKEAAKLFHKMLQRDPEFTVVKSLLALAYYQDGNLAKAKAISLKVDKSDKGYDDAMRLLIEIYSDEQAFDAAINLLQEAISEFPDKKRIYFSTLASLYEKNNQLDKAEDVFKEAVELFPGSTQVYFKFGMFFERNGKIDQAMAMMEKVLTINPKEPYALNYIGYSWAELGIHLEKALDYIQQAVEIMPGDGFIKDSLGWVYYRLGEKDQAAAELEAAIKIEPEDPTIHEHLGDVYQALGKKKKALEHFRESLSILEQEEKDKDNVKKRVREKVKALE